MSHIVLSGGGLKGLAIIGFMQALQEYNMKPQAISGASIGAIIGTMMSIGYSYKELYEFIEYFNYDEVCDFEISDFMEEGGIETGNKITRLLQAMIKNKLHKYCITFEEHYEKTNVWLIINASCLNTQSCEYFSYKTHPTMYIHEALRMTMSLPLWFKPVHYQNSLYVDGGLLDNFPIKPFIDSVVPTNEIIGVKLQHHNMDGSYKNINSDTLSYLSGLWSCIYNEINKQQIKQYNDYNIFYIVEESISAFTPELSLESKLKLYTQGYEKSLKEIKKYIEKETEKVLENILSTIAFNSVDITAVVDTL